MKKKILLIDNGTTLLDKLKVLIPGDEIVHKWNDVELSTVKNFDLIVLSGSSDFSVVGNENKLKNEIDIIRNSGKPIIGICFGCELIAHAFGGKLKKMPQKESGVTEIRTISSSNIFDRKSFKVYERHSWIIDEIPSELEILARSSHGIAAIKHKELPIYGLQFHPENLVDQTYGDEIFMNLFSLIG